MKKFIVAIIAALTVFACVLGGCVTLEGQNGRDLSIYDIYAAVNEARREQGLEELDFLEFVSEYLSYDGTQLSEAANLKTVMNRSLLSTVGIISGFQVGRDVEYAAGSGVIVDLDRTAGNALILTNCHVVYSDESSHPLATEVYVYLYGNDDITTAYGIEAEIVGASVNYDLALIKIEHSTELSRSGAIEAAFAPEEEVYAGASVYAVGNPEYAGLSVTVGIISRESEIVSLNLSDRFPDAESLFNDYRVIRTDAAINGGNSGGGLFDSSGRLVGIVNSKDSGAEGMGYALAGSYAKRIWKLFADGYGYVRSNGTFGLERAVFAVPYTYTSISYFDSAENVAKIEDRIIVSSNSGEFKSGDKITRLRILNGDKVVEDVNITRHFMLDDVILSARRGYVLEYTVERGDAQVVLNVTPQFVNCA